jgi:hypothetical protein
MAEAVFAGKYIKELSLQEYLAILAAIHAKFACLPENLFVSDRPGDARDRYRKYEQHQYL